MHYSRLRFFLLKVHSKSTNSQFLARVTGVHGRNLLSQRHRHHEHRLKRKKRNNIITRQMSIALFVDPSLTFWFRQFDRSFISIENYVKTIMGKQFKPFKFNFNHINTIKVPLNGILRLDITTFPTAVTKVWLAFTAWDYTI